MRIGELAKAAGISASALRFYESSGILTPPRRKNGMRDYDPSAIDELRIIAFYRSCGVSIDRIAKVAPNRTSGREDAHDVVRRRLAELDAVVAQAQTMKRRLRSWLRCKCRRDRRRCVIFREAFQQSL